MNNWYLLAAIPVFGLLILVHEFGHFITAKWTGIRVEEFGLGFPPRLVGIRKRNTGGWEVIWFGSKRDDESLTKISQRDEGSLVGASPTTTSRAPDDRNVGAGDPVWGTGNAPARLADALLTLPPVYQAETIGQLLLAPRTRGEAFTSADRRLLDDLARQAGIAAHAVRLTTEFQRGERYQVVLPY